MFSTDILSLTAHVIWLVTDWFKSVRSTIKTKQMEVRSNIEKMIIEKAMKDDLFRSELIANPKQAIEKELGIKLPESMSLHVLEETDNTFYLTLPPTSENTGDDELTENELSHVAAGNDEWAEEFFYTIECQ